MVNLLKLLREATPGGVDLTDVDIQRDLLPVLIEIPGFQQLSRIGRAAGVEDVATGARTGEEFLEEGLREGLTGSITEIDAGKKQIQKIIKQGDDEALRQSAAKWEVDLDVLKKKKKLTTAEQLKIGGKLTTLGFTVSSIEALTLWALTDNVAQGVSINIKEINNQATFQGLDLNLAEEQIREQLKKLDDAEENLNKIGMLNPILYAIGTKGIFRKGIQEGKFAGELALQNIAQLMNREAEDETLRQAELTRAEGTERRETERLLEEGQEPGGEFDFEERGLTASEAIQGQIDARIRLQQEKESKAKSELLKEEQLKKLKQKGGSRKPTTSGGRVGIRQSNIQLGTREKKIKGVV